MSLRTIRDENGVYVELPKDKIHFISKEAETIFDLSMENESLEVENKNLKSQIEYLRRSVERKEKTIAELELERVPYTNEYVDELEHENKELKNQLEEANKKLYLCTPEMPQNVHGEHISYVDLVNEIYELKKQLEYLRSGEYYNQLRFENQMLQDVVDNGEVSKEDREFIDCTHRNTELLEENQELKKQLEEVKRPNYYVEGLEGTLKEYQQTMTNYETQQQEFIKYIENEIKACKAVSDLLFNSNKEIKVYKEILQKYKEIIGVKND